MRRRTFLENFNQHPVRPFEHNIFQIAEIPNRRSEGKAFCYPMSDQRGNVIRQDAKMMHGIFPVLPRRLVVKIDVAGPDADEDIAHSRNNLVKDNFRSEHFTIKPDAAIKIGREEVDMMQIAGHENSSITSQNSRQ